MLHAFIYCANGGIGSPCVDPVIVLLLLTSN